MREEVQSLAIRVETGEASITSLESQMTALERTQATQTTTAVDLQLNLEDMEDHSRRNNLQLRGIPEATGAEDLAETVVAIFRDILGAESPPQNWIGSTEPWVPNPQTQTALEMCSAGSTGIPRYTHK